MRLFFILFLFFIVSCSFYEPLEVNVGSDLVNGTLSLDSDVYCDVNGGKVPYEYSWTMNGEIIEDCLDSCKFNLDKVGVYEVKCNVKDSLGNETTDSIRLIVEKEKVKIDSMITFGDSLTYGHALENPKEDNWAELYRLDLLDADMYNYAKDGAKTSDILDNQLVEFKNDTIADGNKLVFLWVGANDIVALVSHDEFKENYINILDELIVIEDATVVLINIPDASKLSVADDIEKGLNDLLSDFGFTLAIKRLTKDVVSSYNEIIYSLADEYRLNVVDMYSFMDSFNDEMISDDRFHPNELGHEMIKDEIKHDVVELYFETEFY